jgi:hypothetical protein
VVARQALKMELSEELANGINNLTGAPRDAKLKEIAELVLAKNDLKWADVYRVTFPLARRRRAATTWELKVIFKEPVDADKAETASTAFNKANNVNPIEITIGGVAYGLPSTTVAIETEIVQITTTTIVRIAAAVSTQISVALFAVAAVASCMV